MALYKFLIIGAFILLTPSVMGIDFSKEANIANFIQELPKPENIKCKFRQEKQVSSITIKSSGDFSFDKTKGVVFYTKYPVVSETTYNSKEYKQIDNIIKAISEKNYQKLQNDFKFYFEKNNANWELALVPKTQSKVSKYINQIEIYGQKNIDKIVINDFNNMRTTIWFYE